jgi:hypothetical protein
MAATVGIYEINGASYTPGAGGQNKAAGSIAYRANDTYLTDTANPVVRPSSATTQSYEKWLHMRCTVAPTTSISNPRFYTTGNAVASGVNFYTRNTNTNTFAQPAAGPAYNAGLHTDITAITSASPKALNTVAAGPWSGTGDIGDFNITWASVGTTAGPGSMGSSTLVYSWDEV